MKKAILLCCCFFSLYSFARDTTKGKPTGWLGMLTLTEKYKDEKNWTPSEQAIVGDNHPLKYIL